MAAGSDLGPEQGAAGSTVVVTGAAGALGRLVCERAAADPEVGRVVAVDRRPAGDLPPGVVAR
jgi:uncharacterized protein YbjT (DUF2867 family)